MNLVIRTTSDSVTVYSPSTVASGPIEYSVENLGTTTVSNVGVYIQMASDVGSIDAPAQAIPATDYQDLLTWGSNTDVGASVSGGVIITMNSTTSPVPSYVTRSIGCLPSNKIVFGDMAPGDIFYFTVTIEAPPATSARRFYVDIVVE